MGLATAVGHCWGAMVRGVPGFSLVAEEKVVFAGIGGVESAEEGWLTVSGVAVVGAYLTWCEGIVDSRGGPGRAEGQEGSTRARSSKRVPPVLAPPQRRATASEIS